MLKTLVLAQLFLGSVFAISQSCIWKDGSIADLYRPCNDSATTGSCCQSGETCLASGLCQGSVGLVYRGACINEWDPEKCLTYCDDRSPVFSNLYPCTGEGGLGAPGPLFWWCGNEFEPTCSTKNGTRMRINPGLPIRILTDALPKTNPTPAAESSSVSATSSATTTSSAPTSLCTGINSLAQNGSSNPGGEICKKDDGKVIAVGAGVGAPLAILAITMFGLYLNERRRRKKGDRVSAASKENLPASHYKLSKDYSASGSTPSPDTRFQTEYRHQMGPAWPGHEMGTYREPREIGTHQEPREIGSSY